ncbi:MAG: NAD(P)-binding protein [Woeseia sp.]
MNDKLNISRRDFMNGIALGLAAGTSLSPLELLAMGRGKAPSGSYPPALTGMRGSHPGAFEVAHAVAWRGVKYPRPPGQTDDTYDLVVVGGGISGLSAAFFYRQRAGADKKILVLDNHDDFGGHATRNEFTVDDKSLICYGGSQTIDTPKNYSPVAKQLLEDVAIETQRFYDYFDQAYFEDRQLGSAIWFSKEAYGSDVLAPSVLRDFFSSPDPAVIDSTIGTYPLSDQSKLALADLIRSGKDYLSEHSREEKVELLRNMSYRDFLLKYTGATEEIADLVNDTIRGYWGIGWDALSALEGYRLGNLGTEHLEIGEIEGDLPGRDEPYIFHFPDGNAGVARSIVRQLIPASAPGETMEDLVTTRVDYSLLDRTSSNVRIRLNSTGVDVRHTSDGEAVDVTYVRSGQAHRVRGRHVILACYNNIIPHICPEVPDDQIKAIDYATKVPLVYISIAIRNWRAFSELGVQNIYIPQPTLMHSFGMDFPVSMGDYRFTQSPEEPAVLHGTFVPTRPNQGLTAREQHIAGRRDVYEMSFDDFEERIVRQLDGSLSHGGFDVERDIAAITVNRWPHGYAYEYNELFDRHGWNRYNGPHVEGRAQIGRISIANSDASAYAYVNGAIDAADRAVNEQIS